MLNVLICRLALVYLAVFGRFSTSIKRKAVEQLTPELVPTHDSIEYQGSNAGPGTNANTMFSTSSASRGIPKRKAAEQLTPEPGPNHDNVEYQGPDEGPGTNADSMFSTSSASSGIPSISVRPVVTRTSTKRKACQQLTPDPSCSVRPVPPGLARNAKRITILSMTRNDTNHPTSLA